MSYSTSCPGGIIGALFRDTIIKDGTASKELLIEDEANRREWEAAGIRPGQMGTRLASGKLVAEGSQEHLDGQKQLVAGLRPSYPG